MPLIFQHFSLAIKTQCPGEVKLGNNRRLPSLEVINGTIRDGQSLPTARANKILKTSTEILMITQKLRRFFEKLQYLSYHCREI